MPETGGMYVYLREGWGRPYAFLYGWAQLVLIRAMARELAWQRDDYGGRAAR